MGFVHLILWMLRLLILLSFQWIHYRLTAHITYSNNWLARLILRPDRLRIYVKALPGTSDHYQVNLSLVNVCGLGVVILLN